MDDKRKEGRMDRWVKIRKTNRRLHLGIVSVADQTLKDLALSGRDLLAESLKDHINKIKDQGMNFSVLPQPAANFL